MRLLLDMGLARSTAIYLRTKGHDAVHLRDQRLQRLSDEQIIAKALSEGRTILTHDLDFGRIVALSQEGLPSVITFRLNDMRASAVNRYLDAILTSLAHEIEAGALVSVNEQSIRVRKLPVGEAGD